jgi:hypothetical protein
MAKIVKRRPMPSGNRPKQEHKAGAGKPLSPIVQRRPRGGGKSK